MVRRYFSFRLLFVPLVFCLLPCVVQAQTGTTLSGRITQTEGGQPLSGALVVIDELRQEVRAGDDGSHRFASVPPGQYHVGVRAEGYSTRRTEATIGATLSESPGIAMREFGNASARPVIRGLDGDRISVLEDGQRMGDLSSQSGDHSGLRRARSK